MYTFSMNVKLGMLDQIPLSMKNIFHRADDLIISSKEFGSMAEAVELCTESLSEIVLAVNHAHDCNKYKILNELNPAVSGAPTISKEWADNEISKMWMIRSDTDISVSKKIHAYAIAQVWGEWEQPSPD